MKLKFERSFVERIRQIKQYKILRDFKFKQLYINGTNKIACFKTVSKFVRNNPLINQNSIRGKKTKHFP